MNSPMYGADSADSQIADVTRLRTTAVSDLARGVLARRTADQRAQEILEGKALAFEQIVQALDLRLSPDGKVVYTGAGVNVCHADRVPMAAKWLASKIRRAKNDARDFLLMAADPEAVIADYNAAAEPVRSMFLQQLADEARDWSGGELALDLDALRAVVEEGL